MTLNSIERVQTTKIESAANTKKYYEFGNEQQATRCGSESQMDNLKSEDKNKIWRWVQR